MRTFTDANDKEWAITIDGPAILRVRAGRCDVPNCKHLIGCGCTGIDPGGEEQKWRVQCRRDAVVASRTRVEAGSIEEAA